MPLEIIPGPFDATGNWYRGALHVHTTESDGSIPPDRTVRQYHQGGWDFVALTDHNRVSAPSQVPPGFLAIRGCEYDIGQTELRQKFHIVGVGLEAGREPRPGQSPQETIDGIHDAGGFAWVAHPYWSGLTTSDLLAIDRYDALEVYNAVCELEIGRGNSEVHLDDLLIRGRRVGALAVDDSHWPVFDALRGWVVVRAHELSQRAIVDALLAGRYYASSGPAIYAVRVTETEVEVECSPCAAISLIAGPTVGGRLSAGRAGGAVRARRLEGRQGQQGVGEAEQLTGAVFALTGREQYGRVRVEDAQGRAAWTSLLIVRS
mgnify:CR=1 FL=1